MREEWGGLQLERDESRSKQSHLRSTSYELQKWYETATRRNLKYDLRYEHFFSPGTRYEVRTSRAPIYEVRYDPAQTAIYWYEVRTRARRQVRYGLVPYSSIV